MSSLGLSALNLAPPLAMKVLFDSLELRQFSEAMKWVIIALVLLIGGDLARLFNAYVVQVFQARIVVWLRERFASSLYSTDRVLKGRWESGYVLRRYAEANELNALLLETVTAIMSRILIFCFALTFLYLWIPSIAIAVIVSTPIVVYLSLQMKKKLEQRATVFQETEAKTNERLGEITEKWQPSLFQSRDIMLERHRTFLHSLYRAFVSYQSTSFLYRAGLHAIQGALFALFWLIGIKHFFMGTMSLGSLSSGNVFLSQTNDALQALVGAVAQVSFAIATYRRVADFVEAEPVSTHCVLPGRIRSLSFKKVRLHFDGNDVLSGLSFDCKEGQWVVCVGENGTGKTSLLRLVAGLEVPSSGSILVNQSVTVPYFSEVWMKRIVFVQPHPFIVEGTIRENLTVAGGELKQAKFEELIDRLGYRRFWEELPMGLDTQISSSRDAILSHGQRQLIEWVRWLLYPPRELYLLDEPLTGVVPEVRERCFDALKRHAPESIVFVTTQERGLRDYADSLLVFARHQPVRVVAVKPTLKTATGRAGTA